MAVSLSIGSQLEQPKVADASESTMDDKDLAHTAEREYAHLKAFSHRRYFGSTSRRTTTHGGAISEQQSSTQLLPPVSEAYCNGVAGEHDSWLHSGEWWNAVIWSYRGNSCRVKGRYEMQRRKAAGQRCTAEWSFDAVLGVGNATPSPGGRGIVTSARVTLGLM